MSIEIEKLQSLLTIVNQHVKLLAAKNMVSAQQFKKLVLKRLLAENILVLLMQFIGLKLTALIVHPSPLWFATGTSCAYLFLRGYSVLPGIWLGSFLSFYLENIHFLFAAGYATVLTLQGLLLLGFSYRYLSPTLIFHRLGTFIIFIVYTMMLTGMVSFMFFWISSLSGYHAVLSSHLYLQWWSANFNGILILSCALVTWDAYFPDFHAVKPSKSTICIFGLLLVITFVLVCSHATTDIFCLLIFIVLLNAVISIRLGWCGAMTVSFISGLIFYLASFMDAPVFFAGSPSWTLLGLQLFLSVNTLIGLGLTMSCKKTP